MPGWPCCCDEGPKLATCPGGFTGDPRTCPIEFLLTVTGDLGTGCTEADGVTFVMAANVGESGDGTLLIERTGVPTEGCFDPIFSSQGCVWHGPEFNLCDGEPEETTNRFELYQPDDQNIGIFSVRMELVLRRISPVSELFIWLETETVESQECFLDKVFTQADACGHTLTDQLWLRPNL